MAPCRRSGRDVGAADCECSSVSSSRCVVTLVVLTWISTDHFRSFGGAPAGERLERMRASQQFVGGKFQNAEPTSVMAPS